MIAGFDVEALNVLGKMISKFERFHMENAVPVQFDPQDLLAGNEQAFFRIQGIANFWNRSAQGTDFSQYMADLVIACHNQYMTDLTLILVGHSQKLQVYVSLGSENTTRALLEGIFPGIALVQVETGILAQQLSLHLRANGVITRDSQP